MRYETRLRIERRRLAISERWWQFKLWLLGRTREVADGT